MLRRYLEKIFTKPNLTKSKKEYLPKDLAFLLGYISNTYENNLFTAYYQNINKNILTKDPNFKYQQKLIFLTKLKKNKFNMTLILSAIQRIRWARERIFLLNDILGKPSENKLKKDSTRYTNQISNLLPKNFTIPQDDFLCLHRGYFLRKPVSTPIYIKTRFQEISKVAQKIPGNQRLNKKVLCATVAYASHQQKLKNLYSLAQRPKIFLGGYTAAGNTEIKKIIQTITKNYFINQELLEKKYKKNFLVTDIKIYESQISQYLLQKSQIKYLSWLNWIHYLNTHGALNDLRNTKNSKLKKYYQRIYFQMFKIKTWQFIINLISNQCEKYKNFLSNAIIKTLSNPIYLKLDQIQLLQQNQFNSFKNLSTLGNTQLKKLILFSHPPYGTKSNIFFPFSLWLSQLTQNKTQKLNWFKNTYPLLIKTNQPRPINNIKINKKYQNAFQHIIFCENVTILKWTKNLSRKIFFTSVSKDLFDDSNGSSNWKKFKNSNKHIKYFLQDLTKEPHTNKNLSYDQLEQPINLKLSSCNIEKSDNNLTICLGVQAPKWQIEINTYKNQIKKYGLFNNRLTGDKKKLQKIQNYVTQGRGALNKRINVLGNACVDIYQHTKNLNKYHEKIILNKNKINKTKDITSWNLIEILEKFKQKRVKLETKKSYLGNMLLQVPNKSSIENQKFNSWLDDIITNITWDETYTNAYTPLFFKTNKLNKFYQPTRILTETSNIINNTKIKLYIQEYQRQKILKQKIKDKTKLLEQRSKLKTKSYFKNNLVFNFDLWNQRLDKKSEIKIILKYTFCKSDNAYIFVQNLSKYLISYLKKHRGGKNKTQQLKKMAYKMLLSLYTKNQHKFNGLGLHFSGRVYGAKKASSFKMLFGAVPLNTLAANIDYAKITQKTINGTWGFKTWLHIKKRNKPNILYFSTKPDKTIY